MTIYLKDAVYGSEGGHCTNLHARTGVAAHSVQVRPLGGRYLGLVAEQDAEQVRFVSCDTRGGGGGEE